MQNLHFRRSTMVLRSQREYVLFIRVIVMKCPKYMLVLSRSHTRVFTVVVSHIADYFVTRVIDRLWFR